MSIVDTFQLFFYVISMMVGTPIIGLPMAFVLSILLTEQIAWRRHLTAIRNY